jgi:hypothetical protein
MMIAKRLRRQADTCAQLAAATHDEESRERYLRLEQLYRHMLISNDDLPENRFTAGNASETPEQRPS